MTEAAETILKTDTKGRVKTPPERREKLLDEFERSGLSGTKFAELAGVKYQTFAAWIARRRKQRGLPQAPGKRANTVQWLQAVVQEAGAPAIPLRVRLSTGAWIELSDLNQNLPGRSPGPCLGEAGPQAQKLFPKIFEHFARQRIGSRNQ